MGGTPKCNGLQSEYMCLNVHGYNECKLVHISTHSAPPPADSACLRCSASTNKCSVCIEMCRLDPDRCRYSNASSLCLHIPHYDTEGRPKRFSITTFMFAQTELCCRYLQKVPPSIYSPFNLSVTMWDNLVGFYVLLTVHPCIIFFK